MDCFLLNYEIDDASEFFTALDSCGAALTAGGSRCFSTVSHVYLRVTKAARINDIAPSIGNELILSSKASDCLIKHVRFCPSMSSIPATFYRSKTTQIVKDEYMLWWASKQHLVLDPESAQVRYYKQFVLTVDKWVIRKDLIPAYDIFLGPTNKWLVSSFFRNICMEWDLTGFRFSPVEIR
jgi:hypothetical protein